MTHPGTAINYIWRHQHKATPIQDLRKAIKHLEFEIERLQIMGVVDLNGKD